MRLFDELKGIKHYPRLMAFTQISIGLLACFAATGIYAQTPAPTNAPSATNATALPASAKITVNRKTRVLTLDECIKLALEHNLDIQIQRYNPIIDQFNLNSTYGAYEPVGTFTGTKYYNDSPSGFIPGTTTPSPPNIFESDTYTPGIAGVLPTGLQYDLTGSLSRNSQLGGNPPFWQSPSWISDPGITLSQPLLRNFWIDNTRLQIKLNKATLKISEAALRLQIMTSVTAVKTAYFNLLYARGNVDANATAYKLAEQLVTENLKRVEVGALAPLDEKQSESQAAASLAATQAAASAADTIENNLKNLLTDDFSEWADVSLLPAEELKAVPQTIDLQESWRRAVNQRPDLVEAKLRVEAQNVTLKYNFNQLFPELDVRGSYGRNANESTVDANFGRIKDGDQSFYSYGAFVSIPLGGNITARGQYRSAKATLKQLLLSLKQTEQNIIVAVDNDVGTVRSQLQQVQATHDARVYAEDALAAEKKKLENGKSTSFVVLQLISNLTTAKVNEIQALANYNNAVAQLQLDEGSTLDANHIDLNVK